MSRLQVKTIDVIDRIARLQDELSAGRGTTVVEIFELAGVTPADIAAALDRGELDAANLAAIERTVGDLMSVGDETAIVAGLERALQSCCMSRTRRMAHHVGRARGHASVQGIIRYGWPQMIARPE